MKMGYGELALKEETDGMAEINLWDLIAPGTVVRVSLLFSSKVNRSSKRL